MTKLLVAFAAVAGFVLAVAYYLMQTGPVPEDTAEAPRAERAAPVPSSPPADEAVPEKAVLDITVHTIKELQVVLDRAEKLAMTPRPPGEGATVVLVLHGPEVEFFAISNYEKYKEIVDQAARLDAFEVVDVKICQTMLEMHGIRREDIPSFIEQVPLGPQEVDSLINRGYVYF